MSSPKLYKYSGAGNDFVVLEDCGQYVDNYRSAETIRKLCDRHNGLRAADGRVGADGLMILSRDTKLSSNTRLDFQMEFYNPDGTSGMMCGNGGRCIVAFADFLGIKPHNGLFYSFLAADGLHTGQILSRTDNVCQVRLKMIDAFDLHEAMDGFFINTGTRHFVKFVDDVNCIDIESEGPRYRYAPDFEPDGANANFISLRSDGSLDIRTWEKGVEAETLACGTGITAAAIVARSIIEPSDIGRCSYTIHARIDSLQVEFTPTRNGDGIAARDIYLIGPTKLIV